MRGTCRLLFLFLFFGWFTVGFSGNVTSRPAVINVGAMFTFDSTIGKVAKIAIEEAVKDVNANSSILPGTDLVVKMVDTNCSGFLGIVEGLISLYGPIITANFLKIVVNFSFYLFSQFWSS